MNISKKVKIGVICTAILLLSLALIYLSKPSFQNTSVAEGAQELTLTSPTFPSSISPMVSTLNQEAGMSIWLNATQWAPLSLVAAKSAMVNIENATSSYVVGSIDLTSKGFGSDEWPHCIVFASGWIVVYYLKINTVNPSTTGWIGKMIALSSSDWYDTSSHQLNDNLLHYSLVKIAGSLPTNPSTSGAQYYHFQYPQAKVLQIAIKYSYSGTVTFNIKVPSNVTVDEYSWSFYSAGGGGANFKIDNTQIVSAAYRAYGGPQITSTVLTPDVWHTVSIYAYYWTVACILILYH
jgi:hypothetical protein